MAAVQWKALELVVASIAHIRAWIEPLPNLCLLGMAGGEEQIYSYRATRRVQNTLGEANFGEMRHCRCELKTESLVHQQEITGDLLVPISSSDATNRHKEEHTRAPDLHRVPL